MVKEKIAANDDEQIHGDEGKSITENHVQGVPA